MRPKNKITLAHTHSPSQPDTPREAAHHHLPPRGGTRTPPLPSVYCRLLKHRARSCPWPHAGADHAWAGQKRNHLDGPPSPSPLGSTWVWPREQAEWGVLPAQLTAPLSPTPEDPRPFGVCPCFPKDLRSQPAGGLSLNLPTLSQEQASPTFQTWNEPKCNKLPATPYTPSGPDLATKLGWASR